MHYKTLTVSDENQIRVILEDWSVATRQNRKADSFKNHLPDALIYDVLPPLQYESTEIYCENCEDRQPETLGDGQFDLENLKITVGSDLAFAHCLISSGGIMPDGRAVNDLARATFCLQKLNGTWKVAHQHISKPYQNSLIDIILKTLDSQVTTEETSFNKQKT